MYDIEKVKQEHNKYSMPSEKGKAQCMKCEFANKECHMCNALSEVDLLNSCEILILNLKQEIYKISDSQHIDVNTVMKTVDGYFTDMKNEI